MGDIAEISECILQLQSKVERFHGSSLKEAQTRMIFIDPILKALGWDLTNPQEADVEHATIDGKAVDYALKINGRVVLLVEAKSLDDVLIDVKAITQVVGYASNEGVDWCILTNGITYKIYHSTEKASAPEKLLFGVSINPKETSEHIHVDYIAEKLNLLSPEAMKEGSLDQLGEELFTREKVRKGLGKLFADPPSKLIAMVKGATGDASIKADRVKEAIMSLWEERSATSLSVIPSPRAPAVGKAASAETKLGVKRGKTVHPPVKALDGKALGSISSFARNHNPPLKYEGMRTAIDVLTACKSPDNSDYDFHYDVDYRKDGVYVVRKQGPGYRTFQRDVDDMRRKAGFID